MLTNILSPLSMHWTGNGEMSTFCFSLGINAKPIWLMDDLPWSGPNHIMVLNGCVLCMACTLLACPVLCQFALCLCHCPPYDGLYEFVQLFLPHFRKTSFGSLKLM